jgi:hypothetical protein
MASRWTIVALSAAETVGVVTGCGASGTTSLEGAGTSDAGEDAGSLATVTGDAGPGTCGDGRCSAVESCRDCAIDCGQCPRCDVAPSCSNALGVPTHATPRPDLSEGVDLGPDAGAPIVHEDGCKQPELRMRVARVTTYKGGGKVYCVVSASDGASSEVAITAKTKDLGGGESNAFDPSTALFWGQKELHPTADNLTVTYNCFVVKSDAWAKAMGAMGDAANAAGGVAGPYGWAFGLGSVAASVAAAAIEAASGDHLVLNAQQTIDKTELLDLTNGRAWSIRKSGGGLFDRWDWQLDVESWGCADGASPAR